MELADPEGLVIERGPRYSTIIRGYDAYQDTGDISVILKANALFFSHVPLPFKVFKALIKIRDITLLDKLSAGGYLKVVLEPSEEVEALLAALGKYKPADQEVISDWDNPVPWTHDDVKRLQDIQLRTLKKLRIIQWVLSVITKNRTEASRFVGRFEFEDQVLERLVKEIQEPRRTKKTFELRRTTLPDKVRLLIALLQIRVISEIPHVTPPAVQGEPNAIVMWNLKELYEYLMRNLREEFRSVIVSSTFVMREVCNAATLSGDQGSTLEVVKRILFTLVDVLWTHGYTLKAMGVLENLRLLSRTEEQIITGTRSTIGYHIAKRLIEWSCLCGPDTRAPQVVISELDFLRAHCPDPSDFSLVSRETHKSLCENGQAELLEFLFGNFVCREIETIRVIEIYISTTPLQRHVSYERATQYMQWLVGTGRVVNLEFYVIQSIIKVLTTNWIPMNQGERAQTLQDFILSLNLHSKAPELPKLFEKGVRDLLLELCSDAKYLSSSDGTEHSIKSVPSEQGFLEMTTGFRMLVKTLCQSDLLDFSACVRITLRTPPHYRDMATLVMPNDLSWNSAEYNGLGTRVNKASQVLTVLTGENRIFTAIRSDQVFEILTLQAMGGVVLVSSLSMALLSRLAGRCLKNGFRPASDLSALTQSLSTWKGMWKQEYYVMDLLFSQWGTSPLLKSFSRALPKSKEDNPVHFKHLLAVSVSAIVGLGDKHFLSSYLSMLTSLAETSKENGYMIISTLNEELCENFKTYLKTTLTHGYVTCGPQDDPEYSCDDYDQEVTILGEILMNIVDLAPRDVFCELGEILLEVLKRAGRKRVVLCAHTKRLVMRLLSKAGNPPVTGGVIDEGQRRAKITLVAHRLISFVFGEEPLSEKESRVPFQILKAFKYLFSGDNLVQALEYTCSVLNLARGTPEGTQVGKVFTEEILTTSWRSSLHDALVNLVATGTTERIKELGDHLVQALVVSKEFTVALHESDCIPEEILYFPGHIYTKVAVVCGRLFYDKRHDFDYEEVTGLSRAKCSKCLRDISLHSKIYVDPSKTHGDNLLCSTCSVSVSPQSEVECLVCMTTTKFALDYEECVLVLPLKGCGHMICFFCYNKVLSTSSRCPMCRSVLQ